MRSSPAFHDAAALKPVLLGQLPRLVNCLFSGRNIHRMAHEYRLGTQGSISIRLADGSYFNHETGEGGDMLALIQHTLHTDFKGALVWARGFVGLTSPSFVVAPPVTLERKIDERAILQRGKAFAMLKRATDVNGTLAEVYLREKRGITMEALPTSLRFLAHAYNYTAGGFYPAMIAPIRSAEGEVIAAHCTFLDPATGDKLQGDGIKSRLIFGACRGGALRLAEVTERLALCEGIEDGLSVLQCAPDWPVWVTGGTSGLRTVQIPPRVREVMICADRDEAGMQAARNVSVRLVSESRTVRIAFPPTPHKDFNATLLAEVGHVE